MQVCDACDVSERIHDDWDEYDRAMADGERIVVLVAPDRILGVAP